MSSDDDWENEALGDQRASGMTVDAARKLLQVNPSLRKQGADTDFIIKQSGGQPASAPRVNKGPEGAKESQLAMAKDPDHLLELAAKHYQQEKRELEVELSMIQAKIAGLKNRYLKATMDKLEALDRNMTSPMTQAAMQQHKSIVAELGFTPQKFMEHLRSKR